jgi:hypothetical protein
MSLTPDPKTQPAPDGNQPVNVRPGSSMAVIGVFLEVIRRRFTAESGLPWVWHRDIKQGTIAIESAFNEDKDHANFRPAIFVDRDEMIVGRTVIGDTAGQNLRTGLKAFWALISVPILLECVATKKGESATIADLTGIFLHASSDLIQSAFGLHEMTPPSVSRTQPFPRDKDQWVTSISFSVQYGVRWTNVPTAPLLQQIVTEVARSGYDSATTYFEYLALTGTSDVVE